MKIKVRENQSEPFNLFCLFAVTQYYTYQIFNLNSKALFYILFSLNYFLLHKSDVSKNLIKKTNNMVYLPT